MASGGLLAGGNFGEPYTLATLPLTLVPVRQSPLEPDAEHLHPGVWVKWLTMASKAPYGRFT